MSPTMKLQRMGVGRCGPGLLATGPARGGRARRDWPLVRPGRQRRLQSASPTGRRSTPGATGATPRVAPVVDALRRHLPADAAARADADRDRGADGDGDPHRTSCRWPRGTPRSSSPASTSPRRAGCPALVTQEAATGRHGDLLLHGHQPGHARLLQRHPARSADRDGALRRPHRAARHARRSPAPRAPSRWRPRPTITRPPATTASTCSS